MFTVHCTSIDFIERFVRIVSIGPDMFQVAVLTYNVEPTVLFDLDDHTKEEGIIDALQTIRGHDAVTFTAHVRVRPLNGLSTEFVSETGFSNLKGGNYYVGTP
jgi:hypothetical protein